MKKILITGGAGFIGSHLAKRLLARGDEVTVLDNLFTGTKRNIYGMDRDPRFTFVLGDVTEAFWGQFDQIYNLACPASPVHYQRNPVETIRTSFVGMLRVLDMALKTKARVLHTSTSEVYGDPLEFTILELASKILEQIPASRSRLVYRDLPRDDPRQRRPDIALARELLGWEPSVPLDEGLKRTIAYFRELA